MIIEWRMAVLDNVETVFENKEIMMRKLKKAGYIKYMEQFRSAHGHYFDEMVSYVNGAEDKAGSAKEVADAFVLKTKSAFTNRFGKIWGRTQADINLFMVFYVFPAILLTENEDANAICDAICTSWAENFPGNKIGYTTYEQLLPKFREKIFGIF